MLITSEQGSIGHAFTATKYSVPKWPEVEHFQNVSLIVVSSVVVLKTAKP